MPNLYFTIGLPRSGKSTLCDMWVNHVVNIDQNNDWSFTSIVQECPRTIICADSIRLALSGQRFNLITEDTVDWLKHQMIKTMLIRGFNVIVDGTNTTLNSIKKLLIIHPYAKYVYIQCTKEECQQRAKKDNMPDLISVIERMQQNLDTLTWQDIEDCRNSILANKSYNQYLYPFTLL